MPLPLPVSTQEARARAPLPAVVTSEHVGGMGVDPPGQLDMVGTRPPSLGRRTCKPQSDRERIDREKGRGEEERGRGKNDISLLLSLLQSQK